MLNVNVINAKNSQKLEVKAGQPVSIKVEPNTRFELADGASGNAPTQIKARRVGDSLEIVVDEKAQIEDEAVSNAQTPDLVLENYYKQEDVSLFAGEGEQAVSYVPVDGAASTSYAAMNTSATTGAAVAALPLLSPWTAALAGLAVAGGGGGGGSSSSATQVTNKAPVAKYDVQSVTENGHLEGAVPNATDADGSVIRYELVGNVSVFDGILIFNPNGTYKFNPSGFDYLAVGETASVSFKYVAVDNKGAKSDPQTVKIVITGTNDAPEIVAVDTAAESDNFTILISETDSGISTKSTLTVRDKDLSETVTFKIGATKVNFEGTTFMDINPDEYPDVVDFILPLLTLDASPDKLVNDPHNLVWSFNYSDEEAQFFDLIPEGKTLMINYTIEISDPQGAVTNKVVSVSISGKDDAPKVFLLEGDRASGNIVNPEVDVKGSLTILDADIIPDVTAFFSDVTFDGNSVAIENKKVLYDLLLIDKTSTFEKISEDHNYDWVFDTASAVKTDFVANLEKGKEHILTYSMIFKGTYDEGCTQNINISFEL